MGVLLKLFAASQLSPAQTNDVVRCLRELNAYDRGVCSAIARCFVEKTSELDAAMRQEWLESFRAFKHEHEADFLQFLEVPPVPPIHANYRKVRCLHFCRGTCAVGSTCTFSHDPHAPLSLTDGANEDWWKSKASIMMTSNQRTLGQGSYGTGPLGYR